MGKPNKEYKLLAIDQSISCTAWIIFEGPWHDMTSFGCIKTEKDTEPFGLYRRSDYISNKLKFLAKQTDKMVREGLGFGGSNSNASRDLAYLVGAIESKCGVFHEVAPTRVKKFATGSGKSDKSEMISSLPEHIIKRFKEAGYKKTTGLADLADAYWIGQWYINTDQTEVMAEKILKDKNIKKVLIEDFGVSEGEVSNEGKRKRVVYELIKAGRIK